MDKQTILAMISTLNAVEVRGKENLDRILGCIVTLEDALKDKEEQEEI